MDEISMVLSGCSRPSSKAKSVAFRLVSCTPPVFFKVTKAFVTSPMPCVTSMLVLQPNTSTEMDGPLGRFVRDGVSEINTKGVFVGCGRSEERRVGKEGEGRW